MTRISEAATITVSGVDIGETETLERAAYLVWMRATKSQHSTPAVGGGYEYVGSMTEVLYDLWPELSHRDRHKELEHLRTNVYEFLRKTGHARCTDRGQVSGTVKWWLAQEWRKPNGVIVLRGALAKRERKPVAETYAEARVTSKEAGEDREPAPVQITFIEPKEATVVTAAISEAPPAKHDRTKYLTDHHRKMAEEHELLVQLLIEALGKYGQPLTAHELAHYAGCSESTARKTMDYEVVPEGKAFSRVETGEDRATRFGGVTRASRAKLYSLKNPVPARTQREAIPGFVAELATTEQVRRKGANAFAVYNALSARRWEQAVAIGRRAGVPNGSVSGALRQLHAEGRAERTTRVVQGRPLYSWRRVSGSTPPPFKGEIPPKAPKPKPELWVGRTQQAQAATPAPPPPPEPTQAGPETVDAIVADFAERLGKVFDERKPKLDMTLVEKLERENAKLQTKVEKQQAALNAALGVE